MRRRQAEITSRDYAMREYLEDRRAHLYRKIELADPGCQWLIPLCQVNEMYPDRHPQAEIDSTYVRASSMCARCSERIRF